MVLDFYCSMLYSNNSFLKEMCLEMLLNVTGRELEKCLLICIVERSPLKGKQFAKTI